MSDGITDGIRAAKKWREEQDLLTEGVPP